MSATPISHCATIACIAMPRSSCALLRGHRRGGVHCSLSLPVLSSVSVHLRQWRTRPSSPETRSLESKCTCRAVVHADDHLWWRLEAMHNCCQLFRSLRCYHRSCTTGRVACTIAWCSQTSLLLSVKTVLTRRKYVSTAPTTMATDTAPLLSQAASRSSYRTTTANYGAAGAVEQVPPADLARVRFVGERRLIHADGSATFDWQSIILLRLRRVAPDAAPCALMVDMAGGWNAFNLLVGGRVRSAVQTRRGARKTYTLPIGGAATDHECFDVHLVKRTEPAIAQLVPPGKTTAVRLFGFTVPFGWELAPLAATPPTQRRIEFLGDSDLAAFGLEGPPSVMSLCGVLGLRNRYQNITNSWAHTVARMLQAEPSVLAWSGVGVRQNAAMSGEVPMGELYRRAVATDDTVSGQHHDFGPAAIWSPQLVIVQVGGNDLYGGKSPPSEAAWVESYVALLRTIRQNRPEAIILNLVYSLDTPGYDAAGAQDGTLVKYTEAAVNLFITEQAGVPGPAVLLETPQAGQRWPEDGGSLEHWGRSGHMKYAAAVCDIVERQLPQLGWGCQATEHQRDAPEPLDWIEHPPSL